MELTERQRREKEFHERFAEMTFHVDDEIDFRCVDGPRDGTMRRPWNAYWAFFEELIDEHERLGGAPRLLDFGCGPGGYSVLCARIGYRVDGFDISERSVDIGRQRADIHGYGDRITLRVGIAEDLDYPDATFDVVAGIDILHHVDIERALREVRRVLRPGGLAIFKEPLEAAVFDRLRTTWPLRTLAPRQEDFENYITEDERKVSRDEIRRAGEIFPRMRVRYFRIFSRVDRLARLTPLLRPVERYLARTALGDRFDRWLVDRVPFVHRFCGEGILMLRKDAG